jgi:hypothetical protein
MVITGAELVRLSGAQPFDRQMASGSLRRGPITGEEVSA